MNLLPQGVSKQQHYCAIVVTQHKFNLSTNVVLFCHFCFATVAEIVSYVSLFSLLCKISYRIVSIDFFFLHKYLCYRNVLYLEYMRDLFLLGSNFYCFMLPETTVCDFLFGSSFLQVVSCCKNYKMWKTHTYCDTTGSIKIVAVKWCKNDFIAHTP